MYDFPELRPAHAALWNAIAENLGKAGLDGIPDLLTFDGEPAALWQAPDLLLSQTCGLPLVTSLGNTVKVVATPQIPRPRMQRLLVLTLAMMRRLPIIGIVHKPAYVLLWMVGIAQEYQLSIGLTQKTTMSHTVLVPLLLRGQSIQ